MCNATCSAHISLRARALRLICAEQVALHTYAHTHAHYSFSFSSESSESFLFTVLALNKPFLLLLPLFLQFTWDLRVVSTPADLDRPGRLPPQVGLRT